MDGLAGHFMVFCSLFEFPASHASLLTKQETDLEPWLQLWVVDYNQLKGQASASARKQTGSLAVRDLSTIVKASDVTETENITTLFVVVGKHTKKDWLENYETLSDYVVRAACFCCRIPLPLSSTNN